MKAFDNYEIWWVTGAQLLYGGDAENTAVSFSIQFLSHSSPRFSARFWQVFQFSS